MKTSDLAALSTLYRVRRLGEADLALVYALCLGNPLFYRYNGKTPSLEDLRQDLHLTPPGVPPTRKYYLGFFEGDSLLAVLDLIDGYPDADTAFIGFFLMNPDFQGRGLGSALIGELAAALGSFGFRALRLAIDKGNPQSGHFWRKNGFTVLREVPGPDHPLLLAERRLTRPLESET